MIPAARLLRAAAALLLVALCGAVVPGAVQAPAAGAESTGLSVTISSITPGELPRRGPIEITGTVRNTDTIAWAAVNAYALLSRVPATTPAELAAMAEAPIETSVGARITTPGRYATLGDLEPGESRPFRIRLPRALLATAQAPGAYGLEIHALGETVETPRDDRADGRARTFLPLVPRETATVVPVSLVVPLRQLLLRTPLGRVEDPGTVAKLFGPDGRLGRISDVVGSAAGASLTWLIDPAVLDAAEDLARGNPGHSVGTAPAPADPDASAAPGGADVEQDRADPDPPTDAERAAARSWLGTVLGRASAPGVDLAAVPYADPDVSALIREQSRLVRRTVALSSERATVRGLRVRSVVAPPGGAFDLTTSADLPAETVLLLADRETEGNPVAATLGTGRGVVLADTATSAGGPGPSAALTPLALRQRVLAEAAVRAQAGVDEPLVVSIPEHWNPVGWREADLFGGLQTSWVRLRPLPQPRAPRLRDRPAYGRTGLAREVSQPNLEATRELADTGRLIGSLLDAGPEPNQSASPTPTPSSPAAPTDGTDGGGEVPATESDTAAAAFAAAAERQTLATAIGASSYAARTWPRITRNHALVQDSALHRELAGIEVTGSPLVTLSGGSGSLSVSVVNRLPHRIRVGLTKVGTADVEIADVEPRVLAPGERNSIRLPVSSEVAGVHQVRLTAVTAQGQTVGTPLNLDLRTSQVGAVFRWVIIGCGVLLAVLVARRVGQRLRDRARERGRPTR